MELVTWVATTYKAAEGLYLDGTTYYANSSGTEEVDTSGFEVGVTDVSSYFVVDVAGHCEFGYHIAGDGGTAKMETAQFSSKDYWKVYKVTISISDQEQDSKTYTQAEVLAAIGAKTFNLNVSRNPGEGNTSVALFKAASSSTDAMDGAGVSSLALATGASFNSVFTSSSDYSEDYYFLVYADGALHESGSNHNANFQVALTSDGNN